jgi:hypothetical protein
MHALGLFHIDQDVPAESTYYEFRRLLTIHNAAQSRDLLLIFASQIFISRTSTNCITIVCFPYHTKMCILSTQSLTQLVFKIT